jgi:hypothetical protein
VALTIKENVKIAVMKEVTEGTFVPPAAGGDFIGVLAGVELSPAKGLLERKILTGSIGKVVPRTGEKSVTASVGLELKSGQTAGAVPECGPFVEATLGATRTRATPVTTKTGNTASVLQIQDADISALLIGDMVMVKKAGAYHVSPITARTTGTGAATVTLLVAHPSGSIPDACVIAPFVTFLTANTGHPSLSISKYVESAVLETAVGCRPASMALAGFATGQLPSLAFKLEGLTFDRTLSAPAYAQSLDTTLPPVILNANVYMDGVAVPMNDVAFSVDNTIAFATSTASANGRISGRVASRAVKGTLNPYKQDDSLAQYNRFNANTLFSLFAYAYNPTSTPGEFDSVVAFYLPKCIVTELKEGDASGILQDAISFTGSRGTDGLTEEVYIGFV